MGQAKKRKIFKANFRSKKTIVVMAHHDSEQGQKAMKFFIGPS